MYATFAVGLNQTMSGRDSVKQLQTKNANPNYR